MNIDFTKSQIENLMEFIEFEFLDAIRKDTDIDNINYVADMMEAYTKLKDALDKCPKGDMVNCAYMDCVKTN